MKHPAEVLRELLGRPGGVFAFGVSNAFDAILAVMAGHEAIYSGGYAASAMRGFPDIGQVTATEMLQHHQYITDTVKQTPCIGDADDGYGDAKNVRRTIYDLLTKTRLAAIHLEDQVGPKRCGHIAGKGVLSLDEAVGKIRAAVKVRKNLVHRSFLSPAPTRLAPPAQTPTNDSAAIFKPRLNARRRTPPPEPTASGRSFRTRMRILWKNLWRNFAEGGGLRKHLLR